MTAENHLMLHLTFIRRWKRLTLATLSESHLVMEHHGSSVAQATDGPGVATTPAKVPMAAPAP